MTFGNNFPVFVYFSPFWYVASRKIWQPWIPVGLMSALAASYVGFASTMSIGKGH
jgi:hypothetical protein